MARVSRGPVPSIGLCARVMAEAIRAGRGPSWTGTVASLTTADGYPAPRRPTPAGSRLR